MRKFDCLINKNNKVPNPNMEYFYRMEIVWTSDSLINKKIKHGTIVNNVIQLENGGYQFTNKETGEILRTNYGWALAENTPENLEKIKKFDDEKLKFHEHKKLIEALLPNIDTLQG